MYGGFKKVDCYCGTCRQHLKIQETTLDWRGTRRHTLNKYGQPCGNQVRLRPRPYNQSHNQRSKAAQ